MKSVLEESEKHIRLLGIITARWAAIDIPLWQLVSMLLDDRRTGHALYFSSGSQKLKFDIIDSLLNSSLNVPEEKKNRIRPIIKKLRNLNETRNDIIHCYVTKPLRPGSNALLEMAFPDPNPEFVSIKHRPARAKNPAVRLPLTIKHLETHAEAIYKAGEDLNDINFEDFREWLKTRPKTRPSIKPPKKPKSSPEKSQ